MSEEILKACPFCRSSDAGPMRSSDGFVFIECDDCGGSGPPVKINTSDTEAQQSATEGWNGATPRTPSSPTKEMVEAAYREGWHEGYATGDAGGSYRAVENDWLGSDAQAALSAISGVGEQPAA